MPEIPRVTRDITTNDRLAALEAAAAVHVHEQRPENTLRAYATDWAAWTTYTERLGIPELTATAGALVGYVVALERLGKAPATVERRLSGAVSGLRQRDVEVPRAATEAARRALNGYVRRLAEAGETRGRGQAPAALVRDLRAMCAACPDTLAGVRDRALLLVGFGIAGRRSEVASLHVPDVVTSAEGLEVTIRYGKSGGRTVAVPAAPGSPTCPLAAWQAWMDVAGLTEGPAFRRVDRHGRVLGGLSGQGVGLIVARAAERAGLTAALTGHSLRAGLATEARRAGHDATAISRQGGWSPNSRAMHRYLRNVDRWSDNPMHGIGL